MRVLCDVACKGTGIQAGLKINLALENSNQWDPTHKTQLAEAACCVQGTIDDSLAGPATEPTHLVLTGLATVRALPHTADCRRLVRLVKR